MSKAELKLLLKRPDVQQAVLAGYTGPFALGVVELAAGRHGFLFRRADRETGERKVVVDGRAITVKVEGGYVAPSIV